MDFSQRIAKKRDGWPLTKTEIAEMIRGIVSGEIPDYQTSAMLMAIFFRGMTEEEVVALTQAMIDSGERIDLSDLPARKVDKHSTGGVGDKVSLVLAPLVASAGLYVPMMSGRGLGHTGGTLDKLESIPGFRTDLDPGSFKAVLKEAGFAMIGQTDRMVPADRKLYALRDVTATVPSIPLICSSILSKKVAEGADALVLDVKTGRGAFFQDITQSRTLARTLVRIGNLLGLTTRALLTPMDEPLGRAVGNWPEVYEAVKMLRTGEGPEDLRTVTLTLVAEMLIIGGVASDLQEAFVKAEKLLHSGEPFRRFLTVCRLQGGDPSVLEHPDRPPHPARKEIIFAPETGYVIGIDALAIGLLAVSLGAGRSKKEDPVDPAAGLVLHKKTGEHIVKGEPLATLYTNRAGNGEFRDRLIAAYTFRPVPSDKKPWVLERICESGT